VNPKRQAAIESGLTSIAAKVLAAVPITEDWTPTQIHGEMIRNGIGGNRKIIDGCLQSLEADGLIVAVTSNTYRRPPNKKAEKSAPAPIEFADTTKKPKLEIVEMTASAQIKAVTKPAPGAIDKLSAISARALKLSADLRALADDIDGAAVEIEDMMKGHATDSAKLKQLQSLLSGA